MSTGMAFLVGQDRSVYWTDEDIGSYNVVHEKTLERLGWSDRENVSEFVRFFVRVECPEWDIKRFRYDEAYSLPGWARGSDEEIRTLVGKLLEKINRVHVQFEQIRLVIEDKIDEIAKLDIPPDEKIKAFDKLNEELAKARAEEIEGYKKIPGYVPE
jgi:hypothetical protein